MMRPRHSRKASTDFRLHRQINLERGSIEAEIPDRLFTDEDMWSIAIDSKFAHAAVSRSLVLRDQTVGSMPRLTGRGHAQGRISPER